jgi:hypothetical protein
LVERAAAGIAADSGRSLYLATSSDGDVDGLTRRLADLVGSKVRSHFEAMPEESHATLYHPAALRAFRRLFRPSG